MIPILTLPGPTKFPLGQMLVTAHAHEEIEIGDIVLALMRHSNCDWGEVTPEDREANERAVIDGTRLLSVYHDQHDTKFWIITEADRSATTVLLPEDY